MPTPPPPDRFARFTLGLAVAIPFIYYGLQLAVAPTYPGYSFVRNVASELGSDRAGGHTVFNGGIMALGAVTLLGAYGVLRALLHLRVQPVLASITAVLLLMNAVQDFWAGCFPMPDPRHGGHPAFVIAMILLPVALTASMWKLARTPLRAYYVATIVLLAAMVPLMSGLIHVDRALYNGLLQRVFTLTIFPPIGVSAWVLLRLATRKTTA